MRNNKAKKDLKLTQVCTQAVPTDYKRVCPECNKSEQEEECICMARSVAANACLAVLVYHCREGEYGVEEA